MTPNIGTTDRALRLLAGIALLGLAWLAPIALFTSTTALVLATVVGVVMIVTALVRFCPLYAVLGIKTCPVP